MSEEQKRLIDETVANMKKMERELIDSQRQCRSAESSR